MVALNWKDMTRMMIHCTHTHTCHSLTTLCAQYCTITHILTHTHTHSLSTHSLKHILTVSPHTYSLTHSHSLSHSHTLTHSHTYSPTYSHTHSHTHSHTSLTHLPTQTHFISCLHFLYLLLLCSLTCFLTHFSLTVSRDSMLVTWDGSSSHTGTLIV